MKIKSLTVFMIFAILIFVACESSKKASDEKATGGKEAVKTRAAEIPPPPEALGKEGSGLNI